MGTAVATGLVGVFEALADVRWPADADVVARSAELLFPGDRSVR
jgi:hypothetical protein